MSLPVPTPLCESDIRDVLESALQNGGDLSELYFEETSSTRISREEGQIEEIIDGIDSGVGLRILFDGRSVYGYTTSIDRESLLALAETLAQGVTGLKATIQKKKISNFRESIQKNEALRDFQISQSAAQLSMSEKIKILQRAERGAREILPQAQSVHAIFLNSVRKIRIFNSDGLYSQSEKELLHLVTQVVAQDGQRTESAHESDGGWVGIDFFIRKPPEEFGRIAARRVKTLLQADPAPSGTFTVVLSADAGGTMIHEAVGHGLEADLACNGLSVYQGLLGKTVASEKITVIDDGTLLEKRGTLKIDDEGQPTRKNILIERGVLKSYLVDRLSSMKFDLEATGNGRRESFRHKPIVRMTNTYIAPGTDDPAQILAETQSGIFVKAMGGGQVNTVTGDFVFAVTEGYHIENGKLGKPIRGATLVGNGPKVLREVDRVGNDLGFATGTCGKDGQGAPVTDAQPTLRIPAITIGGA
jgi:TldD protein